MVRGDPTWEITDTRQVGAVWLGGGPVDLEEAGAVAIKIILVSVRRNLDGSLLVSAATSTGTIDSTEYDCTLVQHDDAWQVEECVVTITT